MMGIYVQIFKILPFLMVLIYTRSVAENQPGENSENNEVTNICELQSSCKKCITSSPRCVWCNQISYASKRCNYRENHESNGCDLFKNPQYNITLTENEEVREGSPNRKAVVMKPQKIYLQLRAHQTVEIPFKFYQTKDSAVDMFFLMDMSKTMEQYITELSNVSLHLVEGLRKITDSLKVGIGVFVEKPMLPFVSQRLFGNMVWKMIDTYQVVTKLTNEASIFKNTINTLHNYTTNNADIPEAGLEAMMQAAVCEDDVGWRKDSRRIIIYCSDAPFHYAGDGILAGAVIPNDGECHMKHNKYQKAMTQDYPSVQQIANVLSEKQVTTIFAVASKEFLPVYNKLSRKIESSYVSELNPGTSTIADIITNSYKNISSTVTMADLNKGFNITFFAKCDGKNWIQTRSCKRIKHSTEVEFKAVITAGDCVQKQNQTITINPTGITGKLDIHVELLCDCDCKEIHNSSECNGRGTETCHHCICNSGFTGDTCECTKAEAEKGVNLTGMCKMDNSSEICSNRGECICGKCRCNAKSSNQMNFYGGKFCECDDFSCPQFNRILCGGPTRGSCICGKCHCTSNYTKPDCSCPTSNVTCLAADKTVCNSRGTCLCGVCTCDSNYGFKGPTCEVPPVCLNMCTVNSKCILCAKSNTSLCESECDEMPFQRVDKLNKETSKICEVVNDQCIIKYQCIIENGKEILKILKSQKCTDNDKKVLIAAIIGGIICAGVFLLIIWKIVCMGLDYREMARFKNERKDAVWTTQMNPIFEPATTEHINPAYKKMN
ncbi:integrin beta-1-like [Argonauta hians]